jgi:hypothetical protein
MFISAPARGGVSPLNAGSRSSLDARVSEESADVDEFPEFRRQQGVDASFSVRPTNHLERPSAVPVARARLRSNLED